MRNKPLHILITSAGSLVAHNILEGLASGRQHYRVTGINCLAGAVSNFLCDRVYLAPPLDDVDGFTQRFNAIVEQEAPDLIIPGRDDDVVYLSARSDLPVMTGPAALAAQLRDKWHSSRLAQRHGLPFAETRITEDGPAALLELAERTGWPLVAKPRTGQASRGVVLVGDAGQLAVAAAWPGYCFQPWLGDVPDVGSLMQAMRGGLPLGWSLPQSKTSMDGWITPAGEIGGLFCTLHEEVVLGRSERVSRIDTPQVHAMLNAYAEALRQEGWRGPFNIQLAPDRQGQLHGFEINGRFTGSAATLSHLGLDFVQGAIAAFTGVPIQGAAVAFSGLPAPGGAATRVDKRFTNWPVPDHAPDQLEREGCWSRPERFAG